MAPNRLRRLRALLRVKVSSVPEDVAVKGEGGAGAVAGAGAGDEDDAATLLFSGKTSTVPVSVWSVNRLLTSLPKADATGSPDKTRGIDHVGRDAFLEMMREITRALPAPPVDDVRAAGVQLARWRSPAGAALHLYEITKLLDLRVRNVETAVAYVPSLERFPLEDLATLPLPAWV